MQILQSLPYRTLTAHRKLQSVPYRIVTAHCKLQSVPYRIVTAHYKLQSVPYRIVTAHYKLQSVPYRTLTAHYRGLLILDRAAMAAQHHNYKKPINTSCEQNFVVGYSDFFQRFEVLSVVALRQVFGLLIPGISKALRFIDTA
jgi:hypothetical protein